MGLAQQGAPDWFIQSNRSPLLEYGKLDDVPIGKACNAVQCDRHIGAVIAGGASFGGPCSASRPAQQRQGNVRGPTC